MVIDYDDLLNKINIENEIKLYSTQYVLSTPLIITNTRGITGGESSKIIGQLIIHNNIIIKNVTFINNEYDKTIIIKDNCRVNFKNCTFIGYSSNAGIYVEPYSNCELILQSCTFSNLSSAISINESNTLSFVKDCIFQFCKIAIDNVSDKCIIIEENITNNLIFNNKKSIFLIFNESFYHEDYYSFCFNLCKNNNYARIKGITQLERFDTISYYVESIDDLKMILASSPCCSTIFLKEGIYSLNKESYQCTNDLQNTSYRNGQMYNLFSDIIITHPVHLIGIHSPTITKKYKDNINKSYGIRIASSNVIIENLKIDGGSFIGLRDGIHFEKSGYNNIILNNIEICRISRRSISIFGNNTHNIIIKNCYFYDSKGQAAIYAVNNVSIFNCHFSNLSTGILCTPNSKLIIKDSIFENILCCFKDCSFINIIEQKNNSFKYVENITLSNT